MSPESRALRRTGHAVDAEGLKFTYEYSGGRVAEFPSEREEQIARGNWNYFAGHLKMALWYGASAWVFGHPADEILRMLRDASREWPAVSELEGLLNPFDAAEYLAATIVAGDAEMREFAAALPEDQYTNPNIEANPVAYDWMKVLQALARGDKRAFGKALSRARENLEPKKMVGKPRWAMRYYGTLLALAEAVHAGDQAAFDRAWRERARFHHAEFAKPAEAANVDGILDWQALALGRLALERGLQIGTENPYAPGELLKGGAR